MKLPYQDDSKIRGINLGGWLLLEPWITPSLFSIFPNLPPEDRPVDEYTFCLNLGQDLSHRLLTRHWQSFITEADIQAIAQTGITHIRLPVGYWALENNEDLKEDGLPPEPWVRGAWYYVEQCLTWAYNHKIKLLVDLHGVPGSQNGFDNSGRRGPILWQSGPKNVERTLRVITRMAMQLALHPHHSALFGIEVVNEPAGWALNIDELKAFYKNAYKKIRVYFPVWTCAVVLHDAFLGMRAWTGFMQYNDPEKFENVWLDVHRYQCFDENMMTWTNEQRFKAVESERGEFAWSTKNLWTFVGEW